MGETLSSGTRVARKPHRCDYCGEPIPKGAEYVYWNPDGTWIAEQMLRYYAGCRGEREQATTETR